jgi:hypothetical protein
MVRVNGRARGFLLACAASLLATGARPARAAVLVESWENTADGWVTSTENSTYSITGNSNTTGVTDQSYSLVVTGTASPSYGQMLDSPSTMSNTTLLATAATISVDVLAGSSFGYQQWSCVFNNNETGYTSIDGFSFSQSPTLNSESTLTWTVPASVRTTLSTSPNPTAVIFQVGGGGGGTMYLDNLRITQVPEPCAASLLSIGGAAALIRRRRAIL